MLLLSPRSHPGKEVWISPTLVCCTSRVCIQNQGFSPQFHAAVATPQKMLPNTPQCSGQSIRGSASDLALEEWGCWPALTVTFSVRVQVWWFPWCPPSVLQAPDSRVVFSPWHEFQTDLQVIIPFSVTPGSFSSVSGLSLLCGSGPFSGSGPT